MLLDICEDNWLFILNHTKYINLFFYFIIIACIFICFLIKRQNLLSNKNLPIIFKIFFFVFSVIILSFLIALLNTTLNKNKFEGCYCKHTDVNIPKNKQNFINNISQIENNKIVIVGDSRMELIENDLDNYDVPTNYTFVAKSGAKLEWFEDTALPRIDDILKDKNDSYQYHVIINMGVNDVDMVSNYIDNAYKYFSYYKDLALKYRDVKFYILSVDPIEKNLLEKYWSSYTTYNSDIEKFNRVFISNINKNKNLGIKYCDSYNKISFKTYDGLHYTEETNQKIIDYIANYCVEY